MNKIIIKFKIFESPDHIFNNELGINLDWADKDAIPFGYLNNIMIIGIARTTHFNTVARREELQFPGRIWKNSKIISFWNPQPTKEQLNKIVNDLNNNWNRFDKRKKPINIDGEWSIEIDNELTKIKDYQDSNVVIKNVRHVYEDAEYIRSNDEHEFGDNNIIASYDDNDARAFGYTWLQNVTFPEREDFRNEDDFRDNVDNFGIRKKLEKNPEMLVGASCEEYHHNLSSKDGFRPGYRGFLKFAGRIWLNKHLITFWVYPRKEELYTLLKDIQSNLKGNDKIDWRDDWKIEVVNKDDKYELVSLKEYTGSLPWDEKTLSKIHTMSPEEKRKILMEMGYRSKTVQGDYRTPPAAYKDITTKYRFTENFSNKMTKIAQDELKNTPGGTEYFDKIDAALKLPQNLDVIKTIFQQIQQEQGTNFNLILTGGFGEWIHSLIKKGVLKVPGNLVTSCGSIRGGNDKLGKTTKGKDVDIIHKKDDIDNQKFIMFDDSFYSGSTKKALEDYLKKFGSEISKTYVLYDGSDVKDPNRTSLYRYYDHHTGTKLGVDLLIDYLYSLSLDIPKDSVRDKVLKGEINTINDIIVEVNKILVKFGKSPIDKLTHKETSNVIKSFEAFEYEELEFVMENNEETKSISGAVIYSKLTKDSSLKYILHVWRSLKDVSDPKYPYLELNCNLEDITIKYYNDGEDGDIIGYYNFYPTKLSTITPPIKSGPGIMFYFEDVNGASKIIPIHYVRTSNVGDKIAKSIYDRVSSYEFQKEFLMERPKDCELLSFIGVNPKIMEDFDYLWSAVDMGLL